MELKNELSQLLFLVLDVVSIPLEVVLSLLLEASVHQHVQQVDVVLDVFVALVYRVLVLLADPLQFLAAKSCNG